MESASVRLELKVGGLPDTAMHYKMQFLTSSVRFNLATLRRGIYDRIYHFGIFNNLFINEYLYAYALSTLLP